MYTLIQRASDRLELERQLKCATYSTISRINLVTVGNVKSALVKEPIKLHVNVNFHTWSVIGGY